MLASGGHHSLSNARRQYLQVRAPSSPRPVWQRRRTRHSVYYFQRYQCCGMTRQLLYQYHLSLSFSTFCRPAKGNLAVSIVHNTIALLKRPHSTGAAQFARKRTIQPLHLRKPGAGEEEASFMGPNFPKDGTSVGSMRFSEGLCSFFSIATQSQQRSSAHPSIVPQIYE